VNQTAPPRHWPRKFLIAASIFLALYFFLPFFLTSLAYSLIRRDAVQPADVIIALSGDARCLREKYAAELYRQGLARKIVVGGLPMAWGIHTGDAAKRYLLSLDIPEADVIVLKDPWNTRIEADLLVQVMQQKGWRSVIVVTEMFHSRRALYTIEPVAKDIMVYSQPLPPEQSRWQPERWWTRREDMGQTVREGLAWINTIIGGLR
jgi:uncharacterized SAM-binding protein YcdF (DUF218 family)